MEQTNKTFTLLSEIGLNQYEAKAYLTLISEGAITAKSISDITGIPYGKVYEIANTLSRKGFSMVLPSKPMKYRAVSPYQAAIYAKKDAQEKIDNAEERIIKELEPLFKKKINQTTIKSSFVLLNGRTTMINKTEELIKKANKKINIRCSANSLSRFIIHKEILKKAHEKGVKISICTTNKNLPELNNFHFCNLREVKSENNFISIDGKESLLSTPVPDDTNPAYGRDLGINALSNSFTKFIDSYYETISKHAKKIKLLSFAR